MRVAPEGAVFLLAGGVSQGKAVREPVDRAGDRIGILDGRVVSVEGTGESKL